MSRVGPIRRDMLAIVQDEMLMTDRIAALLVEEPRTIPELAEQLDAPTYEVQVWVSAMRRYGNVEAVGRADVDGYFKYELREDLPGEEE
jgi:predicted Rossmann fold nucleotide-binding protein DprA/Smf involved in DNA uptake